jgi:hypothetical protein
MATLAGRPTSAYRLRDPAPGAPSRLKHGEQWLERPGVAQFLYLSALLHAIAILLFGAPPGGSRDGRAMWGSLNVQLVAPAGPIEVPAPMAPIVAFPLPKLERELQPPRDIVTPQVAVPSRMEGIAPPQLNVDKMLPEPKIQVVPIPNAPPIAVPAPFQPIVPQVPRVERTMIEPPKLVVPLAQPVAPPVKDLVAPPVEVPRVETTLVPALPASPALPAIERVPEIAPKVVPATAPPAPEPVTPKVEAPASPPPDAPASREELVAPRTPARPAPPVPSPPQRRANEDYDPTKPSISAEEMRRRASQIAREGTGQRALLAFPMPAPPERKSKTEEALEKARKPDCRTAYQGLGLLAAVPLIANEFGEGTCRW